MTEVGLASWYGREHHGKRTASGEPFDMGALTAAHRSLPFGTWVRVTHLTTGQTVTVRINDRGPWVGGRVIDLSRRAAQTLGILGDGVARVRLEVVRGS
ncbi:MAG: septal ring lytic transglycosylase RlpA family protein [candidate division NC10 bacterium]|nr:septal ring lytic transglycosylase RlpA family protein [candidate division NC10 bacterium]